MEPVDAACGMACGGPANAEENFFVKVGTWCQRKWTDLTGSLPENVKKLGTIALYAAPFFIADAFLPFGVDAIIGITVIALEIFDHENCGWIMTHAAIGWGFSGFFSSMKFIYLFEKTLSPGFLVVGCIEALCGGILLEWAKERGDRLHHFS